MAAAWSMPVEFSPPRLAVVIDKSTHTRALVAAGGMLGLVVPGAAMAPLVLALGSESGRDVDKFARHQLPDLRGPVLGVPVLEAGAAAWLECRVIPERHTEDAYDTCFVEVVAAAANPRVFAQGHWRLAADNADLHTLHYLGGGQFVQASDAFAVAPAAPKPEA